MYLGLNRRLVNSKEEYLVNVGVEGDDTNLKIAGILTITWLSSGKTEKFISEYSSDSYNNVVFNNNIYPKPSRFSKLSILFKNYRTMRKRARPSDI